MRNLSEPSRPGLPGGVWVKPEHGERVKDMLHFAAYAYPTHPGDPPIDHVNFTIGWRRSSQPMGRRGSGGR